MKYKVAIITDSNSGVSNDEAHSLGINVVPMPFYVNEKLYHENITINQDEFFKMLEQDLEISTSQPTPGDILELWNSLLKEYDEIIHIPMSSGLSGSYMTAAALADDFNGKVFVINNKRISVTQRQSVLEAISLRNKGFSGKEIAELLNQYALNASIYITVDTLKYLKKGGRVTTSGAALGTVLNIKPVLQIQGDKLDAFKKARGRKQAMKIMINALENDLKNRFNGKKISLYLAYSGNRSLAEDWEQMVKATFPEYEIFSTPLPLSISCHIGAGAIGIGCVENIPEAQ
ncbi:DegV family protein [Clostridium culturomicium]|uniref:DegV family protein n=1 Tax=Clostridium culturomicium TaxID=1499683 RepID=UPI00058F97E9|nr:DegV family protein [Clostridium culturomicium]